MPNLVDDSEDSEDEEEDNFLSAGEKLNATMPPPHAHLPLEVEVGQGIVFSLSTPPTPPTPPTPLDTARHPRHSTLDTLDTPTTSEHPGRQDRRRHSLDTLDTLDTGVNRHTLDTPSTLTRHSLDTRSTHSTPLTPRHTRAQVPYRTQAEITASPSSRNLQGMVEVWKHVGTLIGGQGRRDRSRRGSVDYAKTACSHQSQL